MFKKNAISILLGLLILSGSIFTFSTSVNAEVNNGWVSSNNTWHYYQNGAMVKNSWMQDSNGWCFLISTDGALLQ